MGSVVKIDAGGFSNGGGWVFEQEWDVQRVGFFFKWVGVCCWTGGDHFYDKNMASACRQLCIMPHALMKYFIFYRHYFITLMAR